MSVDEQNNSVTDPSKESQRSGEKRLESLLLENSENSVNSGINISGWQWFLRPGYVLLLFLLCFSFAGLGYLYLEGSSVQKRGKPSVSHYVSPRLPIPARPKIMPPAPVAGKAVILPSVSTNVVEETKKGTGSAVQASSVNDTGIHLFEVKVGPFLGRDELDQAISDLQELGFQPEQIRGDGLVKMIRLQKGIYPDKEARAQLEKLKKKVKSAFLLRDEEGTLAVYAGSFHQEKRALKMQEDLAKKGINVTLVDNEVIMKGTMLTVLQADQQTAREVADHIATFGFYTQIEKKK